MSIADNQSRTPSTHKPDVDSEDVTHLENSNTEGTLHQSQLGAKVKRKGFFSPLDFSFADAVHQDAETVVYTEAEEVCYKFDHSVTI